MSRHSPRRTEALETRTKEAEDKLTEQLNAMAQNMTAGIAQLQQSVTLMLGRLDALESQNAAVGRTPRRDKPYLRPSSLDNHDQADPTRANHG